MKQRFSRTNRKERSFPLCIPFPYGPHMSKSRHRTEVRQRSGLPKYHFFKIWTANFGQTDHCGPPLELVRSFANFPHGPNRSRFFIAQNEFRSTMDYQRMESPSSRDSNIYIANCAQNKLCNSWVLIFYFVLDFSVCLLSICWTVGVISRRLYWLN